MAGAALRMTWHHFLKQAQCFAKTHGLGQLQTTPHHTTLHSAAVGEVTTATTPKSTTPTTFCSISGFALPSMHRNNSPLL